MRHCAYFEIKIFINLFIEFFFIENKQKKKRNK